MRAFKKRDAAGIILENEWLQIDIQVIHRVFFEFIVERFPEFLPNGIRMFHYPTTDSILISNDVRMIMQREHDIAQPEQRLFLPERAHS